MNGEVIKSFLVGLGFGVDDKSLSKFNKAISSATLKVSALYGATKLAAAGIAYGISKISEGFEQMGYEYHIIAPAINKALMLRRELLKAYSAAGINITKVIQSSVKLNFSLAKTKFAFQALYQSVASRFFDTIRKQSDAFRERLYANLPKIQATLERFIEFTFKFIDAVTKLATRLWEVFARLDEATGGWSTRIIAAVAAWKLLNLSFLATPLGLIIAGLTAILVLFDDFSAWKEGNKSLFDWTNVVPVINFVTDALSKMLKVLSGISDVIAYVLVSLYQLSQGDFSGLLQSLGNAGAAFTGIFTNPNAAQNLQNPLPAGSPVSSNIQNAQTNQHVQQQTNINVQSSADATSVGKAVAGEQSRVNFDMVRNLQGATR